MKENKKIVTALDIGSSKILAVVAEVYKDGTFRVLAQGRTESQGVLDGNVTSIEEVQPQVKSALVEAFGIAGKIPSNDVCTNISGKSVEGKDSSAEMPLRGRTVTLSDMKNVQSMAQDAVELKEDQRLIKSELLYYMLDNQDEGYVGQNPIDAKSSRISAHMHSAVASAANALARVKVIRRSGMDISRILPEAWASGYAVLTEDEIQKGVVLIDIGAGTTDVAVFQAGLPRFTYTLNYGGYFCSVPRQNGFNADRACLCIVPCKRLNPLRTSWICVALRKMKRSFSTVHLWKREVKSTPSSNCQRWFTTRFAV